MATAEAYYLGRVMAREQSRMCASVKYISACIMLDRKEDKCVRRQKEQNI